jgi:hypothetical protein
MNVDSEDNGRAELRRLLLLFIRCNCGGPQPSLNNSRADEHRDDCPYRIEVECDGNSGQ